MMLKYSSTYVSADNQTFFLLIQPLLVHPCSSLFVSVCLFVCLFVCCCVRAINHCDDGVWISVLFFDLLSISSRPGQTGRIDGYLLEGKELEFYVKKSKKKSGK